jgi:hypothetical protein
MERNTEFDDRESWQRPDKSDDKIEVRILDQPRSVVHSVCVYPSRNLKCTATKCNREPDQCADLSEWEEVEKRAGKKQ